MATRLIKLETVADAGSLVFTGAGCVHITEGSKSRMSESFAVTRDLKIDYAGHTFLEILDHMAANAVVRRTQAMGRMEIDSVRTLLQTPETTSLKYGGKGQYSGVPLFEAGIADTFPLRACSMKLDEEALTEADRKAVARRIFKEQGADALFDHLGIPEDERPTLPKK